MENDASRNTIKKRLGPKHFRRWALRLTVIAGIIGVTALAGIVITILPGIPPFNRPLLSFIENKTSTLLLCDVSIGAVTLDLRRGLVVTSVVLSDSLHTPLRAEQLSARINLAALLKRRFEISELYVRGLSGKILSAPGSVFVGPVDLTRLITPDPVKKPVKSEPMIRVISAERITVSYVDSTAKMSAAETISRIRLEFMGEDLMTFMLNGGAGNFSSPEYISTVRSLDLEGTLGPGWVLVTRADLQGDSLSLAVSGTIPFSNEKPWDLTADARTSVATLIANVPSVNRNAPQIKPVGKIGAHAEMSGSILRPVLKAAVAAEKIQYDNVAADSLSMLAEYSGDHLRGRMRVWSRWGSADASVRTIIGRLFSKPVFGEYSITASVEKVNFSDFLPLSQRKLPAISANAVVYAGGSGVLLPDTLSAVVSIPKGLPGPVSLTAQMTRKTWQLSAGMNPDVKVSGNGTYTTDGAVTGTIAVQMDTLTRIASLFSKDTVRGSVIANALVSGTLQKPAVSAIVQINQGSFGTFNTDSVSGHFRYADQNLEWQSLTVNRGTTGIRSHGAVSWSSHSGSTAAASLFTLDYMISDKPVLAAAADLALAGNIATGTIKAGETGSGNRLVIIAKIPVAPEKHGADAIQDGATVTIRGDTVAYGGLIQAFVPSIQSTGNITVQGTLTKANNTWGLSCSAHVAQQWLALKKNDITAGPAVFDLHVTGPVMRPVAGFSLTGDSVVYQGNKIRAYAGSGSISNEMLKLDTMHFSVFGGGAGLSGRVPLSFKTGFSFNEENRCAATIAAVPLAIAQPFLPEEITVNDGVLAGQISVTGSSHGIPQAAGSVSLRNGNLYIYNCDRELGPLSADIAIRNDSLDLSLQGKWGNGKIAGSGRAVVGAKGISAAKSAIKITDVRLGGCQENLDLGIEKAEINLTKDSIVSLKADIVLAKTRFAQDYSLIDLGEQIQKKAPQTLAPPNPLFDNTAMLVTVNLNNSLTFDSNLGKMLVDGTVTLAGRPDQAAVAGQFQLVNGYVYYLDRKFTITQGTIRQYDPKQINPAFDISATAAVSWYPPAGGKEEYVITISIKDNLAKPSITLSASPSLSQPQIISLLTLGSIQIGVGSDISSRTGSLVTSQLAGFGTRKLARLLDLESIDLYGNVFDPSAAGSQLSVTKQLSSKVALTYTSGLSKLSQQKVRVSYQLLRFLFLEGETDQQAQGGIDLNFRYSK
ncbi:MAG: translocation/assembly module TamB [Chitinispirillaceae bacterium]|jgi:hypothetical protein|nr:translocation/assembly module TamB [Chitinispirillaceae bacterium]